MGGAWRRAWQSYRLPRKRWHRCAHAPAVSLPAGRHMVRLWQHGQRR